MPMPVNLTLERLRAIVENGTFDDLRGAFEGPYLDAKQQPYQLDQPDRVDVDMAKYELAKDVAAFANAGGGYIFIGIVAQAQGTHNADQIVVTTPIPHRSFDEDRYGKLISEWLYPHPKGLTISFVPFGPKPDYGIGVIAIPPQDAANKPCLVKYTLSNGKRTDLLIGYSERRLDDTAKLSAVDLQHLLRIGMSLERELLGRITQLETLIERHFTATHQAQSRQERLRHMRARCARTRDTNAVRGHPTLTLWAAPLTTSETRSLFSNKPGSIRTQLENPPGLRPHGWGLATGATAHFLEGAHLRVESTRLTIDLYRDGTMIYAGRIGPQALAWGDKEQRRLHPLALIETITNFYRFYQAVLNDLDHPPDQLLVGAEFSTMCQPAPVLLGVGPVQDSWVYYALRKAPTEDSGPREFELTPKDFDPDRIAYRLARELYIWFGHTEEAVPYATGEGDARHIDIETIKKIT